MKILAIDFDRVIHDCDHPKDGRKMGEPMVGAKAALTILKNMGYTVIIHSCNRANVITDFMKYYEIPYDSIWQGEGKPVADFYIDDKGLRFTTWENTLGKIL